MISIKSISILLQILFAISSVLSKSFTIGGKEFNYIGSFKSSPQNSRNIDESNYFISVVPAIWTTAEADCKFFFGPNASLLSIESEEEWNFLKIKLESYGSTYWTGGLYSPYTGLWEWSANNLPFPPFAPWDVGYPSLNPNPLLRVVIAHWNRNAAFWRSVMYTDIHPYICKVQRTTDPVNCYRTNDLIIVLDASGSIEAHNFVTALSFVERLSSAFTIHNASRIGFITFSYDAEVIIDITNTLSRAAISSTILNAPYTQGGTSTWLGIDSAIRQFNSSPRKDPLNMVILTDGQSNDPNITAEAAKRATNEGIRLFSLGITEYIDQNELLTLAGGQANRVFTSETFDILLELLAPVSVRVCSIN